MPIKWAYVAQMRPLILVAMLCLSACAPKLTGTNERGGMIKMGLGPDKRVKAFALATEQCEKFNRVPVETGHSEWDNSFRYECRDK
jgi:hypothetical protein